MKNTSNESLIPRETMVVEYVAGNLSERAKQKFELSMQGDTDLQEAVEFECSLRSNAKKVVENVAGRSDQYTASDNFEALLERVKKSDDLSGEQRSNVSSSSPELASQENKVLPFSFGLTRALPIAASFAALGIAFTLLLKPVASDLTAPAYVTLSSDDGQSAAQVDLNSLSAESRVAKIVLANSLDNSAINNMLAAYQLQLLTNLPDQASLIVLADTAMDSSRLNGIKNDDRVKQISLIQFEN